MKKKTKEQNVDTLHAKAVRLAEGGVVEINGHFVRAIGVVCVDSPCYLCDMDSIYNEDMGDLCDEVDNYTHSTHILKLAYKKQQL